MSLPVVKSNMMKAYISCGILESELSQLISLLNMVEIETSYTISDYIPTISMTITNTISDFKTMLNLNRVELHILFDTFNNKTSEVISELEILKNDLQELYLLSIELYMLYQLSQAMEGFLEFALNEKDLKRFTPSISLVKSKLEVFKLMIDENNNKLKVGVRR